MSKIEALEKEVEKLSRSELEAFRNWFAQFDSEVWDRQLESDVASGKLDSLAEDAITAYKRGESRKL
ncbi:MAG: hypothetical protein ABI610_07685 [Acidobacteriota bacterium]